MSIFVQIFLVAPQDFYFYLFLQKGRFSCSRSSKVDKFGANRKRRVDFLLVRNSNFGPILHRFGARTRFMCYLPHLYSTPILGVFPLTRSPMLGVNEHMDLAYTIRPWNYFRRIPTYVIMIPDRHDGQTDGQTDRRTDDLLSHYRALR